MVTIHSREQTKITLNGDTLNGEFVADNWRVASTMTDRTLRQLRYDVMQTWPELFQTAEARKELRRYPAYVLAVVLNQV